MKKVFSKTVIATSALLFITGCGGGGGDAANDTASEGDAPICTGVSLATVPTPIACGTTAENGFFAEHYRWRTVSIVNAGMEFGFDRYASNNGVREVAGYIYDPEQGLYLLQAVSVGSGSIQAASGGWVGLQPEWQDGAAIAAAVSGSDGNEYPVTITSPDDPTFELSLRFTNIVEADISGLDYTDVRFAPSYLDGASSTYPAGSKAYGATYVLMEAANIRAAQFTGTTMYASLQAFKDAHASEWYCLGTGYGVRFDGGANQATLVRDDPATTECLPAVGATPTQVELSTQTFNNVTFLALSGTSLPTPVVTSLGGLHSSDYSILLGVTDNVVTTAWRVPAGTAFNYLPGFGAYLNRTAINAMLTTVGRPQVP